MEHHTENARRLGISYYATRAECKNNRTAQTRECRNLAGIQVDRHLLAGFKQRVRHIDWPVELLPFEIQGRSVNPLLSTTRPFWRMGTYLQLRPTASVASISCGIESGYSPPCSELLNVQPFKSWPGS